MYKRASCGKLGKISISNKLTAKFRLKTLGVMPNKMISRIVDQKNNKVMPADIAVVEKIGVRDWLDNFYLPVSEKEFHELAMILHDLWAEFCSKLSDKEFDVAMSDFNPGWLINIFHSAIMSKKVDEHGFQLEYSKISSAFFEPNWNMLATSHCKPLNTIARINLYIKNKVRNFIFNDHLPILNRLFASISPDAVAIGSINQMRDEYIKRNNLLVDFSYATLIVGGRGLSLEAISEDFDRAIQEYVYKLCKRLNEEFGLLVDNNTLIETIRRRFQVLHAIYKRVQNNAKPVQLLVTESAKPLHKIVAAAWRRGGGTVAFNHGHAAGEMSIPMRSYMEFYAYDKFICRTKACADAFKYDYGLTNLANIRPVNFQNLYSVGIGNDKNVAQIKTTNKKIKTVMIMGFPMNAIRYIYLNGLYWASQLELEIRLVRLLLKNDYEVMYKAHPERREHISKIMSDEGAEVIFEPFESMAKIPDAIIVKYIASSTFPAVLKTQLPVFLIDLENQPWRQSYKNKLARRCLILPSKSDASGRIEFDEKLLLTSLSKNNYQFDNSYANELY